MPGYPKYCDGLQTGGESASAPKFLLVNAFQENVPGYTSVQNGAENQATGKKWYPIGSGYGTGRAGRQTRTAEMDSLDLIGFGHLDEAKVQVYTGLYLVQGPWGWN